MQKTIRDSKLFVTDTGASLFATPVFSRGEEVYMDTTRGNLIWTYDETVQLRDALSQHIDEVVSKRAADALAKSKFKVGDTVNVTYDPYRTGFDSWDGVGVVVKVTIRGEVFFYQVEFDRSPRKLGAFNEKYVSEVPKPALPTKRGAVIRGKRYGAIFVYDQGVWAAPSGTKYFPGEFDPTMYEVVFEGVDE